MNKKSLRVVFMGTPEFSVGALEALHHNHYNIVGVFSQPPRPAQRGHAIHKCSVHLCAENLGFDVYTPEKLNDPDAWIIYERLEPDIVIVAAYGALLPQKYLDLPHYGCINIHASLLPRWRGASPIQSAIAAGDKETGITIMQMVHKLDAGDIIAQHSCPITCDTNGQVLHDELSEIGAKLLIETLDSYVAGYITPKVQDETLVTYAPKLTKDSGRIDWGLSADLVLQRIRAFYPWPGSWFVFQNEIIKVHDAQVVGGSGRAGTVLDKHLTIACGKDAIQLMVLQRPGKKPLPQDEFLRGFNISQGTNLCHEN